MSKFDKLADAIIDKMTEDSKDGLSEERKRRIATLTASLQARRLQLLDMVKDAKLIEDPDEAMATAVAMASVAAVIVGRMAKHQQLPLDMVTLLAEVIALALKTEIVSHVGMPTTPPDDKTTVH